MAVGVVCSMYYHVAVPLPRIDSLTYVSQYPVAEGSRVLVPIGKRIETGIVVGTDPAPPQRTLEILEVLDETPAFTLNLLKLTRRVADYYLCSWGEALFAALPSGITPGTVLKVTVLPQTHPINLEALKKTAPKRAALLEVLLDHKGDITVGYLQKKLRVQSIAQQLDALQLAGYVNIYTEMDTVPGSSTRQAAILNPDFATDDARVRKTFTQLDSSAPKQSLVLGRLYRAYHKKEPPISYTMLSKEVGVTSSVIDALVGKGLVQRVQIPRYQAPSHPIGFDSTDSTSILNPAQQNALETVFQKQPGQTSAFTTSLLEGVTGSGKTVVYQHAMKRVLETGKTCLMLVPEISLTPQLHDRFRSVFGDNVALVHSKVSPAQRVSLWQSIRDGKVNIVIGARSAVFAPLTNLGLIIVDEEHEPSYKQESPAPRYHARDVAVMRGAIEECPVILGSATPSLETLFNAQTHRYRHAVLPTRADGATPPHIQVVDLAIEHKQKSMFGTISTPLLQAIVQHSTNQDGIILFLNRRGFATQLICEDCGHVAQCPNCDVNLTWHKHSGTLQCHYCSHSQPFMTVCTVCGGLDLKDAGVGTQRVQDDLERALGQFPHTLSRKLTVERMDTDTMRTATSHRKLLERFANGEVDIIIGTQMIAKGLDIPRVRLVGIIRAEQTLFQPSFRASERTLQLLIQVAGRSGRRAGKPGEVFIQTYSPTHPVIRAVAENQVQEWRSGELIERNESNFPPFTRFCQIEITGEDESAVDHAATIISRLLPVMPDILIHYPPQPPVVAKIRNRFRRIIVLKGFKKTDPSGGKLRTIVKSVLQSYYSNYASRSVRVTIDVDAV